VAPCALAQDHLHEIRVLADASPAHPIVNFEIWVHFPADAFAWGASDYTLFASEPTFYDYGKCYCHGTFPSISVEPEQMWVCGSQIGRQSPPSRYADSSNPMLILEASWQAEDLTPRIVEIRSELNGVVIFPERELPDRETRTALFAHPPARIRVLDRECYVDCDGSGALDLFDFLCFQNLFGAAEPLADCDLSGALDLFDFLCFQNEFAAGCL
jgi:hypothetical protein